MNNIGFFHYMVPTLLYTFVIFINYNLLSIIVIIIEFLKVHIYLSIYVGGYDINVIDINSKDLSKIVYRDLYLNNQQYS